MELTRDDWRVITDMAQDINRIANALDVLAADVTERRGRERLELAAEHARLQRIYRDAEARFESGERNYNGNWSDDQRSRHRATETLMNANYELLRAFEAAHPELVETAVNRG